MRREAGGGVQKNEGKEGNRPTQVELGEIDFEN